MANEPKAGDAGREAGPAPSGHLQISTAESGGRPLIPQNIGEDGVLVGPIPLIRNDLPGWTGIFPGRPCEGSPPVPPLVAGQSFPEGGWDAGLLATAAATLFAATADWEAIDPGKPKAAADDEALRRDLAALREHALRPPGAIEAAEIHAQVNGVAAYFGKLLTCSAEFRPATYLMVSLAMTVGLMAAMRFKLKYRRARPAQVWPALDPLVQTPRHPSYPNGHALQSALVAVCVGAAVPALAPALGQLASRIGRNRERALVHFPSDTDASLEMAPAIHGQLSELSVPGVFEFGALKRQVGVEFKGARPLPALP